MTTQSSSKIARRQRSVPRPLKVTLVALACAVLASVWVLALTVGSQQDDIHVGFIMASIAMPGLISMSLRQRWDRWFYWVGLTVIAYMVLPEFLLLFLLAGYTWLGAVEWTSPRGRA